MVHLLPAFLLPTSPNSSDTKFPFDPAMTSIFTTTTVNGKPVSPMHQALPFRLHTRTAGVECQQPSSGTLQRPVRTKIEHRIHPQESLELARASLTKKIQRKNARHAARGQKLIKWDSLKDLDAGVSEPSSYGDANLRADADAAYVETLRLKRPRSVFGRLARKFISLLRFRRSAQNKV